MNSNLQGALELLHLYNNTKADLDRLIDRLDTHLETSMKSLGYSPIQSMYCNQEGRCFFYWKVWVVPEYSELIERYEGDEVLSLKQLEKDLGRPIPEGAIIFEVGSGS